MIVCIARRSSPPRTLPLFFFFNDPPPTDTYTLSLHDALPIYFALPTVGPRKDRRRPARPRHALQASRRVIGRDRKSTRLNSSHRTISYAVFCLKKKK